MGSARAVDKKMILKEWEKLSKEAKREVADFIAYLRLKEEVRATKETLTDENLLESILKSEKDFEAGRFKDWSEVKENV